MDLRAAINGLRAAWSDDHVRGVARAFLDSCGWELEAGVDEDVLLRMPRDAELLVYSAAVVLSEHGFEDHVEAIVYLGVDRSPSMILPVHGVLRLYLTGAGEMITEDRYTRADWFARRT